MTRLTILILLAAGCGAPFPLNHSPNYTDYPFKVTGHSPAGIPVDDPRGDLDLTALDAKVSSVLGCLGAGPLPREFGVKVAPDWSVSACSGQQVFPCAIGPEGCQAKGLTPTADCPCRCRAVVQDNAIIVTVPAMTVLPGRLVSLLTGAENPWLSEFAECAR